MDLDLNKINGTGPVTRLFARLMLATALCAGFASAQEPSVIVKSLDDLEKRIIKVEGDLGRLKKNQAATPAPERMPASFPKKQGMADEYPCPKGHGPAEARIRHLVGFGRPRLERLQLGISSHLEHKVIFSS